MQHFLSCNLANLSQTVPFVKRFVEESIHRRYSMPYKLDRVKRMWYLSPMRAAKVQASLRIRAVSPEPSLLAHTSSESRGTFRQKTRSLAHLNGWACAVKMCHDGMLEDTNSLDGAQLNKTASELMRPLKTADMYCFFTIIEPLSHLRLKYYAY